MSQRSCDESEQWNPRKISRVYDIKQIECLWGQGGGHLMGDGGAGGHEVRYDSPGHGGLCRMQLICLI